MDINKLSEKELHELKIETEKKLLEINVERERKKGLKQNYKLIVPEPELRKNTYGMWISVYRKAESGETITFETIKSIEENNTDKIYKKHEIYSCPECGEMRLEVGQWGEDYKPIRKVYCNSCDFVCPKISNCSKDYEAWKMFHEWLIKKGFLPEGTKMID